jgi:hypothetical protein
VALKLATTYLQNDCRIHLAKWCQPTEPTVWRQSRYAEDSGVHLTGVIDCLEKVNAKKMLCRQFTFCLCLGFLSPSMQQSISWQLHTWHKRPHTNYNERWLAYYQPGLIAGIGHWWQTVHNFSQSPATVRFAFFVLKMHLGNSLYYCHKTFILK